MPSYYEPHRDEFQNILDPAFHGFTEKDMDRKFNVSLPYWGGLFGKEKEWTLREITEQL
jgi:hypothetical protein